MVILVKIAFIWNCVPAQSTLDISTYLDYVYLPKKVPGTPEPRVPAVLTPAFKFSDFLVSSTKTRWGHWKDQEPCKDRKSTKTTSVAASVPEVCEKVRMCSIPVNRKAFPKLLQEENLNCEIKQKQATFTQHLCILMGIFTQRVFFFLLQLLEQGTMKSYHCRPDLPMPSQSFWAVLTIQMKMENLQGLDGKKSVVALFS